MDNQDFIPNSDDNPNNPNPPESSGESRPGRKQIKHILIGSPKTVRMTIYSLYSLGYAQVDEWSTPQPTENPGEVISILIRYLSVD
ncbi:MULTISPECIES: hypothetical protein [Moorena]|uniref:Uncharacterized protein n=1 Tax=Moorena producens 3L TaxID=489825 RepID=F4XRJ1_9CYAN|nr:MULTISPECIES: hypothetical protein [Moorena]EGJ32785.1 hypothetical protein LYNGBM3L_00900 [Moorena producens 3L]NEP36565.1 hypothetical protein [Moorena sp. SIO3B2]NEP68064.1 hypothetical protein [Moorena sp. SIO3A5]NEQ08163.1 hypothetical protein [Moorena sp. SIO4E2]NER90012.1 hypothetical protein [Moorena sp. SIO3A2]